MSLEIEILSRTRSVLPVHSSHHVAGCYILVHEGSTFQFIKKLTVMIRRLGEATAGPFAPTRHGSHEPQRSTRYACQKHAVH
jgi:hypothetical protein